MRRVNRYNTDSLKYDAVEKVFGTKDVIPLWVADMDLPSPRPVRRALMKRIMHPVYGYSIHSENFFSSIEKWLSERFDYRIEKDWVTCSPGIVPAINISVMSLTEPGDEIIIQPPVYPPFFKAVTDHDRTLICNDLKYVDGKYIMDLDDLKKKITPKTKMLVLCNPHNPVGRVFTREELTALARICIEHKIIVVSDEIHADIVFAPQRHIPIATISPEIAALTITCMAPSKTFNIAGFATSEIIIENEEIREKFRYISQSLHICSGNILGDTALIAAYMHGAPWLNRTLKYLKDNIDFVTDYAREHIPSLHIIEPESTFLLWLDCREWGMDQKELKEFFIREAGLGLNDGTEFGECGKGFMRMNIGTSRAVLKKAMKQLDAALKNRNLN